MLETYLNKIPLSITSQALLVGAVIGVITYKFFGKKYKLPPGPWGPPLIGSLLSMRAGNLYELLCKWKEKYGPIVTIYFGPVPCVTLNSSEVVKEALLKKDVELAGRTRLYSLETLTNGYKDIVFADLSPQWKIQRKIALQGMRNYASGDKLSEKLFESGSKVMNLMKEKNGQVVDMETYISLIVFNFLYGMCFQKSFEIDDKQFNYLLNMFIEVNELFGNGVWEDIIPPLRYFPTKRFQRIINGFTEFNNFIEREYKDHKEKFSKDDLKDLTDYVINARNEGIKEDPEVENLITDAHLVQTLSDVFSAGIDTTRQTLIWTIFLLVKHPEIQKKAQEEIDSVIGVNQPPSVSDKDRLSYTEAVLHESMRICPVVPFGVPHSALCDTKLGEYDIPKGTMVTVNHYALHMDREVWGDPEVFRPERLLDEDGSLAPKPLSWLPFSAGRRNCLGETIARPEMLFVLTMLLRNFNFSCAEGKTLNMIPNGSVAFLPPKNDIVINVRK